MIVWVPSWHSKRICTLHSPLLPSFLGLQVILPEIAEYDVMVQIKACGLSRIDTRVSWYTALHWQRRRKDSLIGGPQFLILLICSTGHIEWTWHRLKTLGAPPPPPPPVPIPMFMFILFVCVSIYRSSLSWIRFQIRYQWGMKSLELLQKVTSDASAWALLVYTLSYIIITSHHMPTPFVVNNLHQNSVC